MSIDTTDTTCNNGHETDSLLDLLVMFFGKVCPPALETKTSTDLYSFYSFFTTVSRNKKKRMSEEKRGTKRPHDELVGLVRKQMHFKFNFYKRIESSLPSDSCAEIEESVRTKFGVKCRLTSDSGGETKISIVDGRTHEHDLIVDELEKQITNVFLSQGIIDLIKCMGSAQCSFQYENLFQRPNVYCHYFPDTSFGYQLSTTQTPSLVIEIAESESIESVAYTTQSYLTLVPDVRAVFVIRYTCTNSMFALYAKRGLGVVQAIDFGEKATKKQIFDSFQKAHNNIVQFGGQRIGAGALDEFQVERNMYGVMRLECDDFIPGARDGDAAMIERVKLVIDSLSAAEEERKEKATKILAALRNPGSGLSYFIKIQLKDVREIIYA